MCVGRWENTHAFWITGLACSDWSDREVPSLSPQCYLPAGVPENNRRIPRRRNTYFREERSGAPRAENDAKVGKQLQPEIGGRDVSER